MVQASHDKKYYITQFYNVKLDIGKGIFPINKSYLLFLSQHESPLSTSHSL
jgi:hypothetical protein